jgi:hypothetical protein
MQMAIAITSIVVLVLLFFAWDYGQTKRAHLAFSREDVLAALDNVLSEDCVLHDEWDMFLTWPIKDAYLESLRNRCLDICKNDKRDPGRDLSESGIAQVEAMRQELREAPNISSKPKPLRGSA